MHCLRTSSQGAGLNRTLAGVSNRGLAGPRPGERTGEMRMWELIKAFTGLAVLWGAIVAWAGAV